MESLPNDFIGMADSIDLDSDCSSFSKFIDMC